MPPIWVDDFDGPAGAPPPSRHWRAELGGGGWGDGQLQRYTDDPANATDDPSLPATMLVDWIRVNSPRLRVGDAAQHERSGPA